MRYYEKTVVNEPKGDDDVVQVIVVMGRTGQNHIRYETHHTFSRRDHRGRDCGRPMGPFLGGSQAASVVGSCDGSCIKPDGCAKSLRRVERNILTGFPY